MTPGRLIAVVGPSGVGKDSLIDGLCAACPQIVRVRRVITRAADAGGEDFEAVSPEDFARRRAAGALAPRWRAHGLSYGIPAGGARRAGRRARRGGQPVARRAGRGARRVPAGSWLARIRARKPRKLVAIALANKMARQIWSMLVKKEDYRDPALAAAA